MSTTATRHNNRSPLTDHTVSSPTQTNLASPGGITGTCSASSGGIQHEPGGAAGSPTTAYSPTDRNDNSNPQQYTSVSTMAPCPPNNDECLSAHMGTGTDDTDTATATQKPAGSQTRRNHSKIPPNLKDSRKLFVGGLPSDVTEQEFRTFFEQFGSVMDSVVMFDRETQRSRGFGFVTFEKVNVARNVLGIGEDEPVVGCSSRMEMRGKLIEIKAAQPKGLSSSSHVGRYHHHRLHHNKNNKQQQRSLNRGVNKHPNGQRHDAPSFASAPAPASVVEPMAMYGATPFTAAAAAEYHHAWSAAAPPYYHPTACLGDAPAAGFVAGYMTPVSYYASTAYPAMQPLTDYGGVPHPPLGSATLMVNPVEGFAASVPPGALPLAHVMQQPHAAEGALAPSAAGSLVSVHGPAQTFAFFPSVAIPHPAVAAAASTQKASAASVADSDGLCAVEVDKGKDEGANALPADSAQ